MLKQILIQFICIVLLLSCALGKLPADISKCSYGDAQCIIKGMNEVIPKKFSGDTAFGLNMLDPFEIGTVTIKQDAKSPVNIEITFKNAFIRGMKNCKTLKVKGFGKNPEGRHYFLITAPALQLLADYTTQGKVLLLPVIGSGKSNITMVNPVLKYTIDAVSETKNNEIYMKITDLNIDVKCDKLIYHFENLFNGNKELGDTMNSFLNENDQAIYSELKPSVEEIFGAPNLKLLATVFSTTPYKDLFEN